MEFNLNGLNSEFSNNRRSPEDRRQQYIQTHYPFYDCDGLYVKSDRRLSPERRLSNIQVKEVVVQNYIFDSFFE